jgi:Flp pilus assembly protein TadD/predicted aspartyl protease
MRVILTVAAALAACTWIVRAQAPLATADAELELQLAQLLVDEGRYQEALPAFDRAATAQNPAVSLRARKGKVRAELQLAQYAQARTLASAIRHDAPDDADAIALEGDALWSAGLFDEAETTFREALTRNPGSSRARFGVARALATRSQLDEALKEALAALATAPRDAEMHATIAAIYERQNRFDEAANFYTNFINLLPNKDKSDRAAWTRAQIRFLRAFEGKVPAQIDGDGARVLHTVPFRLVNDKIIVQGRVNGSSPMDFILDTGSEQTVVSRQTAQRYGIQPITYTLSAGVGEVGLRGLELARLDTLDIGSLRIRNLPVLIKNPALRGIPKREGESFSPISLGMSMIIDYQRQLLTIGKDLPAGNAEFTLPMRIQRLALVRGVVNATNPGYFVVDTGGQVISISGEMADQIQASADLRRIPLKVWGTSGWDRDAFLLPGQNLNFDRIAYNNFPLVVLNLRAPSVLLGFQVGGIVGHKFLSNYRVAMDLARSELRLDQFAGRATVTH